MSKTQIDKNKVKEIVRYSYAELRKKDKTGATKQATVNEIVKVIEKVLKNGN